MTASTHHSNGDSDLVILQKAIGNFERWCNEVPARRNHVAVNWMFKQLRTLEHRLKAREQNPGAPPRAGATGGEGQPPSLFSLEDADAPPR